MCCLLCCVFFFQAEDGIRDAQESRGLGDVYKRQALLEAAETVGYPLLVKPSAGGGGKGMQVVTSADGLEAAVASSRRLAADAFGDDTLLLLSLIHI